MENEINYPHILDYLGKMINQEDPLLKEMEEYARNHHIPVIQRESGRLLEVLCALSKPEKVLEVGTAIGYSAIQFARMMAMTGIVDTIELDENRADEADKYIRRAGLEKIIRVLRGDAAEILQCLEHPYDFIFLDAAKGQYIEFLPYCLRLLNPGGILVSDNILYRGMVTKDGFIEHKHRTITVRLKAYIDALLSDDKLLTSIIPIGDGMAVSIKKQTDGGKKINYIG